MSAVGAQLVESKGFFFAAISDARSEAAVIAQIPVAEIQRDFPRLFLRSNRFSEI
tara:strand:- start:3020 stop:3184 length:165 start_codon:yes stop_codon:yes gene_type:complete